MTFLNNKKQNDKEQICQNLFVYGTLQHGESRNYLLKGLMFEKATIYGYRKKFLEHLGFPIIIQDDEKSNVNGEVYLDIPQSLFNMLDVVEGEGSLYHRIIVNVKTITKKNYLAYIYYPSTELINSSIKKNANRISND